MQLPGSPFSRPQSFWGDDRPGLIEGIGLYTIVCASQKGGSGKTTLSGHLAVEASLAGAGPVALIDTDPQGSLAAWWNVRKTEEPRFVRAGMDDLGAALAHLDKMGVRLAVIDTPPAITDSISQVVAHADVVVVPTRPSPHDLRAVGATVDIAERHGKPVIFVINGATARARITGESAVALSQHGTVAPVTLHHRVDFAASMIDGRTVGEAVPNSASAKEMRDLWNYLQGRLSRTVHDPRLVPEITPDFALSPLLGAVEDAPEPPPMVDVQEAGLELPPLVVSPDYVGPDRRKPGRPEVFKGPDRRNGHAFGRRRGDPLWEGQFK